MRHIFLVCISVVAACPAVGAKPPSNAAESPNRTKEYFQCNDNVNLDAFKNTQWNACSEAELKRTEARLSLAFKKLRLSLSDRHQVLPDTDRDRGAKLFLSQESWQKFRDDFCEFRAGSGEAPNRENIELECRIDLTREQITLLEGSF